jgi:hypothetical protein
VANCQKALVPCQEQDINDCRSRCPRDPIASWLQIAEDGLTAPPFLRLNGERRRTVHIPMVLQGRRAYGLLCLVCPCRVSASLALPKEESLASESSNS